MPGKIRVLWIADADHTRLDPSVIEKLRDCRLVFAGSLTDGLARLESDGADLVMAELPLADCLPADLLEQVQRADASLPVIIHESAGTIAEAVRLAKLGADQVFGGALDADDLRLRFQAALGAAPRRQEITPAPWKQFLVGESRAIADIERIIRLVAPRRCTILISGETGTGKEVVARAIHLASPRAAHPMVAVNCSALPENLLEAELFGHVKGAFTGALQQRIGRFEQAHGSSLFLDEIADLPLELQAKLLRVLQEREFQRLGSSETMKVDVRVIAASNVDLKERVRRGEFREDLYYRLNVVPIQVPPLRDHLSDIPALAAHFIGKICQLEQMPGKRLLPETLDRLSACDWPGNVRQLENAVEMAVVLSGDRPVLYPSDFPLPVSVERRLEGASSNLFTPMVPVPDDGLDFERTVSYFERSILQQALEKTGGNKKMAADMLRLKRTTLSAKLRSLEAAG